MRNCHWLTKTIMKIGSNEFVMPFRRGNHRLWSDNIHRRIERGREMVYSDFSIEQLKQRLFVKAMKNSTPKKYAGDMLEAAEAIQQLQARIKTLESDQG